MNSTTSDNLLRQRIRRIKTERDEKGRIDTNLLYQQTKKLQKNQINYAIYSDAKADELFPLKPVDINFIQSYTLKDDPKFKQIRHLLQKYNEQVLRYDSKSSIGLHLKTTVIDSMLKFMRLMFQAPDSTAKRRILEVAYYWFKRNIDSGKKRERRSMEKEIRGMLVQANVLSKEIIDKQLPSFKRQQQLYHYQINARSRYPQLNPPGVQLQEYVTHKLGFANQLNKTQQQQTQFKTQQQLKQEKWKQRIIFKRPPPYEPNVDQTEGDLNNMLNQQLVNNIALEQQGIVGDNNGQQQIDPNAQQGVVQGQQQQQQQQVDIGVPADQGDAVQQQPQPEDQDQKRGKLDPLVKIFLMDRQKRIKSQSQINRQSSQHHTKNYKLQKDRLDEINAKFMTQWGGNRARFKSQLSRKIQSIKAFTSIAKAKEEAVMLTAQPLRVENTIYKAKLSETLKQYSAYIHNESIHKDSVTVEQSMSLYDRKRTKTQASSTLKHFSTVLEDNKRINQKSQYLDQIQRLKDKFAKYKLYTPLESFKKAIIQPEEKEGSWAEGDNQSSQGIELPRSQMLSNPFFKVAKKKKKGKKKN